MKVTEEWVAPESPRHVSLWEERKAVAFEYMKNHLVWSTLGVRN